jgi:hypothetical protein
VWAVEFAAWPTHQRKEEQADSEDADSEARAQDNFPGHRPQQGGGRVAYAIAFVDAYSRVVWYLVLDNGAAVEVAKTLLCNTETQQVTWSGVDALAALWLLGVWLDKVWDVEIAVWATGVHGTHHKQRGGKGMARKRSDLQACITSACTALVPAWARVAGAKDAVARICLLAVRINALDGHTLGLMPPQASDVARLSSHGRLDAETIQALAEQEMELLPRLDVLIDTNVEE